MMDWTDEVCSSLRISNLVLLQTACHLYGTSNFADQVPLTPRADLHLRKRLSDSAEICRGLLPAYARDSE